MEVIFVFLLSRKLDVFLHFCDLLWYTWAILLYEKRHEEIYNEIAQAKLHRLKNPRKIVSVQ